MMSPRPFLRLCVLIQTSVTLMWLSACGGGRGNPGPSPMSETPPSNFSYPTPPSYVINQAIMPLVPTIQGTVASYAVSPVLPAGLSVNQGNGAIAGTPAALASKTTYTVTASNSRGSTTASVSIVVRVCGEKCG